MTFLVGLITGDVVDINLSAASTNITGNDALLTEGKEIPADPPVLTDLTNNGTRHSCLHHSFLFQHCTVWTLSK